MFKFEYLDLGIGMLSIIGFASSFLINGSIHRMNKAQLSASPCFTLLAILIITDL